MSAEKPIVVTVKKEKKPETEGNGEGIDWKQKAQDLEAKLQLVAEKQFNQKSEILIKRAEKVYDQQEMTKLRKDLQDPETGVENLLSHAKTVGILEKKLNIKPAKRQATGAICPDFATTDQSDLSLRERSYDSYSEMLEDLRTEADNPKSEFQKEAQQILAQMTARTMREIIKKGEEWEFEGKLTERPHLKANLGQDKDPDYEPEPEQFEEEKKKWKKKR